MLIRQRVAVFTLLGGILLAQLHCKGKTTVYVCNSGKASKYHYHATCPALNRCTYQVIETTKEEAEKEGKTLCKWER